MISKDTLQLFYIGQCKAPIKFHISLRFSIYDRCVLAATHHRLQNVQSAEVYHHGQNDLMQNIWPDISGQNTRETLVVYKIKNIKLYNVMAVWDFTPLIVHCFS